MKGYALYQKQVDVQATLDLYYSVVLSFTHLISIKGLHEQAWMKVAAFAHQIWLLLDILNQVICIVLESGVSCFEKQ